MPSGKTPLEPAGASEDDARQRDALREVLDLPAGEDDHEMPGHPGESLQELPAHRVDPGRGAVVHDGGEGSVEVEDQSDRMPAPILSICLVFMRQTLLEGELPFVAQIICMIKNRCPGCFFPALSTIFTNLCGSRRRLPR